MTETSADFETARRAMVASQLRTAGVGAPRLIDAMARIPREGFVPADRRAVAYADRAVPLAGGRALNPPVTTAQLIAAAQIGPADRVLIVGAASGYALAIVAMLAGATFGIEEDSALAAQARANVPDATVVEGPSNRGAAAHAPFDAIVIDGAIEIVPQALVDQLTPGGWLTAGWIDHGVVRLAKGRRGGGAFALIAFADGDAVVLPGFARPKAFVF